MTFARTAFVLSILVGLPSMALGQAKDTVAITEFMNNPVGEDDSREWIELYNYGAAPVNIGGWQLADEGNDVAEIPQMTIQPGDFVILIVGPHSGGYRIPAPDRKALWEKEWLGGKADARVRAISSGNFVLNDNADQIILRNGARQVVWQLAYSDDGKEGHSTWFASDKFTLVKKFGSKSKPGVIRKGNDNDITGGEFLGYEGNDQNRDPDAYESDVSGLEEMEGIRFRAKGQPEGTCGPGLGSPLKGKYPGAK